MPLSRAQLVRDIQRVIEHYWRSRPPHIDELRELLTGRSMIRESVHRIGLRLSHLDTASLQFLRQELREALPSAARGRRITKGVTLSDVALWDAIQDLRDAGAAQKQALGKFAPSHIKTAKDEEKFRSRVRRIGRSLSRVRKG